MEAGNLLATILAAATEKVKMSKTYGPFIMFFSGILTWLSLIHRNSCMVICLSLYPFYRWGNRPRTVKQLVQSYAADSCPWTQVSWLQKAWAQTQKLWHIVSNGASEKLTEKVNECHESENQITLTQLRDTKLPKCSMIANFFPINNGNKYLISWGEYTSNSSCYWRYSSCICRFCRDTSLKFQLSVGCCCYCCW